ncbi:MAG: AEC family transporter, partial [Chloroflexi bacterium]|nr:AEC family transporter [Chloroflexota bacterium]
MASLVDIAYNVLSPIFIIVGISVLVYRKFDIDSRSLSRLVIYLFTPFTIFEGIAYTDLSGGEAVRLVTVAIVSSIIVAFIAWRVARIAGFDPRLQSAFMLSATLINAGNYGLPVNRFAFGSEGEERALIYFVGTVIVSYTLGVFLASRGTVSTRRAILNVFTIPLPYMVVLGLIVNLGRIDLPVPVDRSVALLSDATIPCMLVILGIQLSQASIKGRFSAMLMASGIRLIVSPLIALG